MFKINEDPFNPFEDLGKTTVEIPVEIPGVETYHVKTDKWEVWLEVDIYDYAK